MICEKEKKVLFVNPQQEVTEQLYTRRVAKQYSKSAYVLPNTSIAYLAAYLEKLGYEVGIVDASALGLTVRQTAERVRELDPSALCYNLYTQNFLSSLHWIEGIKEATGLPVIVGGLQMSIYPEEVLSHGAIDYGVIGEGWETLPELLDCLDARSDLSRVKGICYREAGAYRETDPRSPADFSLQDVPFPARHLLPNDRYTTVMTQEWPITVMLSSLGCPLGCTYCDVPRGRYQSRPAGHVAEELAECVDRFGIKEVLFQDETFTLQRDRVMELCELVRSRGIEVKWSIRARPDFVDREMLRAMKEAGLTKVNFGIESGDQERLAELERNIPLETIRQAVRWTKEEGIITLGFFMIGFPGETVEGVGKTIRFARELDCDFIQVNKMVPQPPSVLYNRLIEKTGIDYWREYTRGNQEILEALPGIGSSFDPATLDDWQRRFFRSFYYRPSYIGKRLRKVRSLKELFSLAQAALSVR